VPLTTAYNQWTQFEDFPRFMEGVEQVEQLGPERLHWVADVGGERKAVHFQEYWIRHQASVPAHAVVPIGIEDSKPAPGVLEAITETDVVLVPPSNPVVSVGTILAVPGIRDALVATPAPVVGVSGIIGTDHVHGMARQLLGVIGVEVSAAGVAEHYGARSGGGILDGWLVDTTDESAVARITAAGMRCRAVPLWMADPDATADMVQAALDLVR
jgi:LPPG:FO 2-phospho-L-lactate transferase